jgi:hypothetical protein
MDTRNITLTGLAIALLASAPALAKSRHHRDAMDDRHYGERDATIEMLKHKDDSLQRESMERQIGAVKRDEISDQRRLIDDVIDDLKDGRAVAPSTIDEAMGYPYQSHYFHRDRDRFHDHDRDRDRDRYGS